MKTIQSIFLSTVFLFSCATLSGQHYEPHFSEKGSKFLSVGVGLLPTFFKDDAEVLIPPSSLNFEKKISDIFSIGSTFGYSQSASQENINKSDDRRRYQHNAYFLGLKLGAHCVSMEKWDIYGGTAIGYYHSQIKSLDGAFGATEEFMGIKPNRGKIMMNAFVGARFSCCGPVVLFGEVSYGISLLTVGVGYKLN
jgi:hypothetical protein